MPQRAPVALLLLALAAPAAGCGGGSSSDSSVERPPLTSGQSGPSTVATTTTATTPTTTTTAPATAPATTPATVPTTPGGGGGAPATQPPSSGGAPASCPSAVGGFVHDVHASGADCGRARSVGEAWFAAVHGGAAPDSQITAAGYSCMGAMDGERADVTCTSSGGGTVSFTASP